MAHDFFQRGAEAVGPVVGEEGAGGVDALVLGIRRDEGGEEGQVFLEGIDVEEAGCVVGGA